MCDRDPGVLVWLQLTSDPADAPIAVTHTAAWEQCTVLGESKYCSTSPAADAGRGSIAMVFRGTNAITCRFADKYGLAPHNQVTLSPAPAAPLRVVVKLSETVAGNVEFWLQASTSQPFMLLPQDTLVLEKTYTNDAVCSTTDVLENSVVTYDSVAFETSLSSTVLRFTSDTANAVRALCSSMTMAGIADWVKLYYNGRAKLVSAGSSNVTSSFKTPDSDSLDVVFEPPATAFAPVTNAASAKGIPTVTPVSSSESYPGFVCSEPVNIVRSIDLVSASGTLDSSDVETFPSLSWGKETYSDHFAQADDSGGAKPSIALLHRSETPVTCAVFNSLGVRRYTAGAVPGAALASASQALTITITRKLGSVTVSVTPSPETFAFLGATDTLQLTSATAATSLTQCVADNADTHITSASAAQPVFTRAADKSVFADLAVKCSLSDRVSLADSSITVTPGAGMTALTLPLSTGGVGLMTVTHVPPLMKFTDIFTPAYTAIDMRLTSLETYAATLACSFVPDFVLLTDAASERWYIFLTWKSDAGKNLVFGQNFNTLDEPYTLVLYRKAVSGAATDLWCEIWSDTSGENVAIWGDVIPPAPMRVSATSHRFTNSSGTWQLLMIEPVASDNIAFLSPTDTFGFSGATLSNCVSLSAGTTTTASGDSIQTTKTTVDKLQVQCRDTTASFTLGEMIFSVIGNGVSDSVSSSAAAAHHTLTFVQTSELVFLPASEQLSGALPIDVSFVTNSLILTCTASIAAVVLVDAAGAIITTPLLSAWTATGAKYQHTVTLEPLTAGIVLMYRGATTANTISCTISSAADTSVYASGLIPQLPMAGVAVELWYDGSSELTVSAQMSGAVPFWSASDVLTVTGVTVSSCVADSSDLVASTNSEAPTLRPSADGEIAAKLTMICSVSGTYVRAGVALSWRVSGVNHAVTLLAPVSIPQLTLKSTMALAWLPSDDVLLYNAQRIDVSSDVDSRFVTDQALVVKCTRALELAVSFSANALISKDVLPVIGTAPFTQIVPLTSDTTMLALLHRVTSSSGVTECTIETVSGVSVYTLFTVTPYAVSDIAVTLLHKVPTSGLHTYAIEVESPLFISLSDVLSVNISGANLESCALSTADINAAKTVAITLHNNGTISLQVLNALQTAFTVSCDVTEVNYMFRLDNVVSIFTNGQVMSYFVKDGSVAEYPALTFTSVSEVQLLPPIPGLSARPVALQDNFVTNELVLECSVPVEAVVFTSESAVESVVTTRPSSWTDVNSDGLLYRRTFGLVQSTGLVLLYRDATGSSYSCTFKEGTNDSVVYANAAFTPTPFQDVDVTVHRDLSALSQADGFPKLAITAAPTGVAPFVSSSDVLTVNGVTLTDCVYDTATSVAPSSIVAAGSLARDSDAEVGSSLSVTCVLSSAYDRPAISLTITASGVNSELSPTAAPTANGVTYTSTTDVALADSQTSLPTTIVYNLTGCFSQSATTAVLECDTRIEAYALLDSEFNINSRRLLSTWATLTTGVERHTISVAAATPLLVLQYRLGAGIANSALARCRLLTDDSLAVTAPTNIARSPLEYLTTTLYRAVDSQNAQSLAISVSPTSTLSFISASDVFTVVGDAMQVSSCTTPGSIASSQPVLAPATASLVALSFTCAITQFSYGPTYFSLTIAANNNALVTVTTTTSSAYPKLLLTTSADIKLSTTSVSGFETFTFFGLERVFTSSITTLTLECDTAYIDGAAYTTAASVTQVGQFPKNVSNKYTLQGNNADAIALLYRQADTTTMAECSVTDSASNTIFTKFVIPRTPATNIAVSMTRSLDGVLITVLPTGAVPYTSASDVFEIAGITDCTNVANAAVLPAGGTFSRDVDASPDAAFSVLCLTQSSGDTSKLRITANGVVVERAVGVTSADGITFSDSTPSASPLLFSAGPSALTGVQFASLTQDGAAFAVGQTTLVCDGDSIEEILLLRSTDSVWTRTLLQQPWTAEGAVFTHVLPEITAAHSGIALLYRTVDTATPLVQCALRAPNKFMYTAMTDVPAVTGTPVLSVLVARVGTATTVTVKSHDKVFSFISRSDLLSVRNIDASNCASVDQSATGFAGDAPAFTAMQSDAVVLTVQCTATAADADYSSLTFVTRYNGVEQAYAAGVMDAPVRVLVDDNIAPVTFTAVASGAKAFSMTMPRFQPGPTLMLVCDAPVPMIGIVSSSGAVTAVALASWSQATQIDALYYHSVAVTNVDVVASATDLVVATRQTLLCSVYDSHGATPYVPARVPAFPLELDATVMPSRYTVSVTFAPTGTFALLEAEDKFTLSPHVHNCVAVTNAVIISGNTVTVQTAGLAPAAPAVVCDFVTSFKRLFDMTLTATVAGVNTTYPLLLTSTPPVSFRLLADATSQPCSENSDCLSGKCKADGACGNVSSATSADAAFVLATAMFVTVLMMLFDSM